MEGNNSKYTPQPPYKSPRGYGQQYPHYQPPGGPGVAPVAPYQQVGHGYPNAYSGYPGSLGGASNYPGSNYPASNYPASNYPASNYPGSNYPASNYPGNNFGNYPGVQGTYPGQYQQAPPAGYENYAPPPPPPTDATDAHIPPDKLLQGDLDIHIRHGFIRKVYCILFIQLGITFGIAAIFSLVRPAGQWMIHNAWLAYVGMGVAMVLCCGMTCFPDALARRYPINMILLTCVALGFSLLMSLLAVLNTVVFLAALATTGVVVLGLTLFACQTKWDFTGCGPFVMVSALVLMVFGIVNIFVRNRVVLLVYQALGALLFSFYLVYDTQQIVGGKHRKFQYSIDDYVFAVLTLYLDIINLFMYILMLFSAASDDR